MSRNTPTPARPRPAHGYNAFGRGRPAFALAVVSLTATACASADGAAAPATPTSKAVANQTLRLDSHRADAGATGVVSTRRKLREGRRYTLTVKGTASYYSPISYTAPRRPEVPCGRPERGAMFRSPGTVDGPVGVDAEFVFARPARRSECGRVLDRWSNFQIRTKRYFFHSAVRAGMGRAMRSDHTYTYTIIGRGRVAAFRLVDGAGVQDNYGVFRIGIRDATTP